MAVTPIFTPFSKIKFNDGLSVTDEGAGVIRVDASAGGSGIQFDVDNEGGSLYVATRDPIPPGYHGSLFSNWHTTPFTFNSTSGTAWHPISWGSLVSGAVGVTRDSSGRLKVTNDGRYRITAGVYFIHSGVNASLDVQLCDDLGNTIAVMDVWQDDGDGGTTYTPAANFTFNTGPHYVAVGLPDVLLSHARAYTVRARYHTVPSGSCTTTTDSSGTIDVHQFDGGIGGMWMRSFEPGGIRISTYVPDGSGTIMLDAGDQSLGMHGVSGDLDFRGGFWFVDLTDGFQLDAGDQVEWYVHGDYFANFYGHDWEMHCGSYFMHAGNGDIEIYTDQGDFFMGIEDGDWETVANSFTFDSDNIWMGQLVRIEPAGEYGRLWVDDDGFVKMVV